MDLSIDPKSVQNALNRVAKPFLRQGSKIDTFYQLLDIHFDRETVFRLGPIVHRFVPVLKNGSNLGLVYESSAFVNERSKLSNHVGVTNRCAPRNRLPSIIEIFDLT